MSDNYRNTPYDGMEEQTMSDKNTPPFNNGDIVRYITSTLIGEERTVSYCRYTSAFLIGEERTVSYSRYTSAFKWRVYFNGDSFDWSDNLELVRPALGSSMPASLKVDNWPMGYCDNGFGHEGEHPLYTSSDNGCKNFITSERLLEIKELFDLTEERDEALAQIENIDYVKRDYHFN